MDRNMDQNDDGHNPAPQNNCPKKYAAGAYDQPLVNPHKY